MAARSRPRELCCPIRPAPALSARDRRRLVAVFRALGDPTRLEILRLVAAQPGPVCACDVGDGFEMGQPTISHHLKVLREAGLLRAEKRGIWSYYALDDGAVSLLRDVASTCCPAPPAAVRTA